MGEEEGLYVISPPLYLYYQVCSTYVILIIQFCYKLKYIYGKLLLCIEIVRSADRFFFFFFVLFRMGNLDKMLAVAKSNPMFFSSPLLFLFFLWEYVCVCLRVFFLLPVCVSRCFSSFFFFGGGGIFSSLLPTLSVVVHTQRT